MKTPPDASFLPRFVTLGSEDLAAIRELEALLGDLCLVAVEKSDHVYTLEMKVGHDEWLPVDEVVRGLPPIVSRFRTKEAAISAKGRLKNFLNATPERRRLKRPVRIRKALFPLANREAPTGQGEGGAAVEAAIRGPGIRKPGLIVVGTSSGCGKTTVAKGLVHLFRSRGLTVQPFKLGPDFIDAGHLGRIAERPTVNLDCFLLTPPGQEERARDVLRDELFEATGDADALVVESVGGLFDDWFHDGTSPAAIAKQLGLPAVLVLDGLKSCQTLGIMAGELLRRDPELDLAGVVVNRVVSRDHYERIVESFAKEHRKKLLGFVLNQEALRVAERHLGLVTAGELSAETSFPLEGFAAHLETERLLAPTVEVPQPARKTRRVPRRCRIAVARDEAFSFYYQHNLARLEALGAELVELSPLADTLLSEDVDGLYLGGGFPELHLERLSGNESLRRAIADRAREGMPIYAECGGLIYLAEEIRTCHGERSYPGVGLLPLTVRFTRRLVLDYVECSIVRPCLVGQVGDKARGHVFHASRIEPRGELTRAYEMRLKTAGSTVPEGFVVDNVFASYAHLHFGSCPRAAESFVGTVAACRDAALTASGA